MVAFQISFVIIEPAVRAEASDRFDVHEIVEWRRRMNGEASSAIIRADRVSACSNWCYLWEGWQPRHQNLF